MLRQVARSSPDSLPEPDDPIEALAIRSSFPSWLIQRWIKSYGMNEAEALANAMNQRPPTTVRVNTLKTTRQLLEAQLLKRKISSRPTSYAPDGLLLEGAPPLVSLDAFREGLLAAQDEASILVSHLVDPQPGETVADVCSAPGTKATHLAQLMGNKGRVIAMDPHPSRLKLVAESCHRLGVEIVECHAGSVETHAPRFAGICDRVLVDAPCSNLGVIRRHPDVKWRRRESDLEFLQTLQLSILGAAAQLVCSGGILVYATCSLEPEENESVVTRFLAEHSGFYLDPPTHVLVPFEPSGFLRLTPSRHGTDGFSAARLRRVKISA
jgi:16S rRNA (cytosine967-C5)-methyltransferase